MDEEKNFIDSFDETKVLSEETIVLLPNLIEMIENTVYRELFLASKSITNKRELSYFLSDNKLNWDLFEEFIDGLIKDKDKEPLIKKLNEDQSMVREKGYVLIRNLSLNVYKKFKIDVRRKAVEEIKNHTHKYDDMKFNQYTE